MNLLRMIRHWQARRRLRDPAFAFLFDTPPENEWISIDFETSSLDPKSAEIISIAAVPVCGHRILRSHALRLILKPSRSLPAESIRIHQLRQQDLADGMSVDEALSILLNFIGPRPLLGYYLEFDLFILNREIRPRLGIDLPNLAIEVSGLYYDYKVSAYRPEVDLRLTSILQDLELPDLPRHDPLNDAILAAMVFLKLHTPKAQNHR